MLHFSNPLTISTMLNLFMLPKGGRQRGVMTDYLRKIRSKVCHAHRVNRLKESAENCYVDGVTIVGVPFCGLKGIQLKAIEI